MREGNLRKYLLTSFFALLLLQPAWGQQVEGRIIPLDHSTEVGRPFKLKMEIYHPPEIPVIFPDSVFGLTDFEYIRQDLSPTQTNDGRSIDQTVFHLYTWNIEEKQAIRLPFKYVIDGDTIQSVTNTDTIRVAQKIEVLTDSLQLKLISGLTDVSEPFNTKLFLIILGIVLIAGIVAVVVLWEPIKKQFRKWRIEREWKKVLLRFMKLTEKTGSPGEYISDLNHLWKNYLQRRVPQPLRTMTTTELKEEFAGKYFSDLDTDSVETLIRASENGDRILYAEDAVQEQELLDLHKEIRGILEFEYQRKKKEAEL